MPLGKFCVNLSNCPSSSTYANLLHYLVSNLVTQVSKARSETGKYMVLLLCMCSLCFNEVWVVQEFPCPLVCPTVSRMGRLAWSAVRVVIGGWRGGGISCFVWHIFSFHWQGNVWTDTQEIVSRNVPVEMWYNMSCNGQEIAVTLTQYE